MNKKINNNNKQKANGQTGGRRSPPPVLQQPHYFPGSNSLVDYAIEHYGAEVIEDDVHAGGTGSQIAEGSALSEVPSVLATGGKVTFPSPPVESKGKKYLREYREYLDKIENEKIPEKVTKTYPPFPCLTGGVLTSIEAKIQEKCHNKILAFGDDTLEINFGIDYYYYADEFQRLGEGKKDVQNGGRKFKDGKAVDWFGEKFYLLGRGSSGGYEYFLQNSDIILWMMPEARGGKPSPEIRVKFLSSFLWGSGEINAINRVIEYINQFAGIVYVRVSRADPCVDLMVSMPEIDLTKQFSSRLRKKVVYIDGFVSSSEYEGYSAGIDGIGHYRIYDKVKQMKEKHLSHMFPIWRSNGYIEGSPSTRLEIEFKREGLRCFDKDMALETYFKLRSGMWSRMTEYNLRIIEPGSATRKRNCNVIPEWQDYQACGALFGERLGVIPYRVKNPQLEQLRSQARGVYATMYAILCAEVGEKEALVVISKEFGKVAFDDIILAGKARVAKYSHLRKEGVS